MEREVDIELISDGKRYLSNDLVKLECEECKGCSDCCKDMGDSILLDPYDVFMLTVHLKRTFESFLDQEISLGVIHQVILPHLKMCQEQLNCSFLSEDGRCKIHSIRPGFCRLFPLGRIYENDSFHYFHQNTACTKGGKSKTKNKKWLGIPNLSAYEAFILSWHDLLKEMENKGNELGFEWQSAHNVKMLQLFFQLPYDENRDFFEQYYERLHQLEL